VARGSLDDGTTARNQPDLETHAIVFPKLFRRLTSYLAAGATGLSGFLPWLSKDEEQVLDLTTGNFTHFDNVLAISRGKVRFKQKPETIVFVSAKTTDTSVAPWMKH
jgi:hypothetical protein